MNVHSIFLYSAYADLVENGSAFHLAFTKFYRF